jgi:hypothetical protein
MLTFVPTSRPCSRTTLETEPMVFCYADSGKPLLQRNILRDGLNPILKKLKLKQDGKAFHSFRRFRVMHLRKNHMPWDLEKFWIGHKSSISLIESGI